jgi:cell division protein FtsL
MSTRIGTVALLGVAVFLSSVALVYIKYDNRMLFQDWHALQMERDKLNVTWGQLQIELNTWARHDRIEQVALEKLKMHPVGLGDVEMVRDDK